MARPCKTKKVKCGEEKPACINCERQDEQCDYSIRLNWEGRTKRKADELTPESSQHQPASTPSATNIDLFLPALVTTFKAGDLDTQKFGSFGEGGKPSHGEPIDASIKSPRVDRRDGLQAESHSWSLPHPTVVSFQQPLRTYGQQQTYRDGFSAAQLSRFRDSSTSYHADEPEQYGMVSIYDQTMPYGPDGPLLPKILPPSVPNLPRETSADKFGVSSPPEGPEPKRQRIMYSQGVPQDNVYDSFAWKSSTPPTPSSTLSTTSTTFRSSTALSSAVARQLAARQPAPTKIYTSSDPRRLSVNSLLSSPTVLAFTNQTVSYGTDRGFLDHDIPRNEDQTVLDGITPVLSRGPLAESIPETFEVKTEFGFGLYGTNRPHVAVRDVNLMHLLLAYSASHRARLLNHAEPSNRIAQWVRDVFPTLRRALEESQINNSNLATAIMLASLEIICPNAFEVPVSWQEHLNMARQMIVLRGPPTPGHHDRVAYFLHRWFTYLDVLGSLSGAKNTPLLSIDAWTDANDLLMEHNMQIDCLFGFTSRCVAILARIADLARRCDRVRIDVSGNVRGDWRPAESIIVAAESLKTQLRATRNLSHTGCPHREAISDTEKGWDAVEMVATNDAFHWAGLIHLNRRVLGKTSDDVEVQASVREIVGSLYKVRKGGTAEACLLFPMFTAGCDAKENSQRNIILERMKSVEATGMTQIRKARKIMEMVWATGKPWESLVHGEFLG
ncbi:hypothetical protein MMC13_003331 [Lambiella insularis]|nr:hypothetical protein [Lambiella insularis]